MKLHELLAIETNLETQAAKVRADLANTFEKKRHLFEEKRTLFTPSAEGALQTTETQSDLQSTVAKELLWIRPHLAKSLDASYRVAETNTAARADIVLEDGMVVAKDIPATELLELQKRLAEIMALAQAIPTLDPAKGFRPDVQRGGGIFAARPVTKKRTTKQPQVIVKYDALIKDGVGIPAQTELYSADVTLGIIEEQEWSGLLTPAEKAEVLNRIEILSRAVRAARSRANDEVVDTAKKIGDALLGYIFG